jgi:hypothetical protein
MLQFALKVVVAVLCCAGLALAQSFEELVQNAEAKLRAKDTAAALPLADAAVKLSPERWDGHFVRAIALLSLGRASDALASAEAAAARAPADRKEAVQKLVERCRPSGGGQRASLVLREAEAAQKEGLDDLAARKFAEAYELDATQTSAALKAAGLYVTLEQFAAAGKLLKVLSESADEAVRTKARDLAEKIRVRVSEPLRMHLDAARAALDGNQLATVKEELAKAETLFDDGEMHYLAAKLAVREKRLAEALQHLKAAKIARAAGVEVVRQDADMVALAMDASAAAWMRDAFGANFVEGLLAAAGEIAPIAAAVNHFVLSWLRLPEALQLELSVEINTDGSGSQLVCLAMDESTQRDLALTSTRMSLAATGPAAVFDKAVVERDLVAAGMTLASHTTKTDAGVRTVALEAGFPTFAAMQQSPLAGTAAEWVLAAGPRAGTAKLTLYPQGRTAWAEARAKAEAMQKEMDPVTADFFRRKQAQLTGLDLKVRFQLPGEVLVWTANMAKTGDREVTATITADQIKTPQDLVRRMAPRFEVVFDCSGCSLPLK